jgi:hypothetical protein
MGFCEEYAFLTIRQVKAAGGVIGFTVGKS